MVKLENSPNVGILYVTLNFKLYRTINVLLSMPEQFFQVNLAKGSFICWANIWKNTCHVQYSRLENSRIVPLATVEGFDWRVTGHTNNYSEQNFGGVSLMRRNFFCQQRFTDYHLERRRRYFHTFVKQMYWFCMLWYRRYES